MNFVGLDLAWGSIKHPDRKPNPTGIAVLDASGDLTYVGAETLDDDIRAALATYVEGRPCVVAIDAPLKVTNQKGQRPAEKRLSGDFGVFDAGPHSANIERFSADPRGARLARVLGLDTDPHSRSPRRAIEVFPHPATVALFKLGRIYKIRIGSTGERRTELLRYMQAIESLAASPVPMYAARNDDWNRLRQQVEEVQSLADLKRAEDQIDAVMCAYVALYAERRPDDVTIYGDFPANGYILTPTLPPGLQPTPRQPVAAATTTSAITRSLSPDVAAEHERCAGLAAGVNAAWSDIDRKVRELGSIPTRDATEAVVVDSLTRVEYILELAGQELSAIRDELTRKATEDADT